MTYTAEWRDGETRRQESAASIWDAVKTVCQHAAAGLVLARRGDDVVEIWRAYRDRRGNPAGDRIQ